MGGGVQLVEDLLAELLERHQPPLVPGRALSDRDGTEQHTERACLARVERRIARVGRDVVRQRRVQPEEEVAEGGCHGP
jgi:hypothetical protein